MPLWSIKFIDTTCLQKPIKNSPLNLFNMRNQKTCSCFQLYHTFPCSTASQGQKRQFCCTALKRTSPFHISNSTIQNLFCQDANFCLSGRYTKHLGNLSVFFCHIYSVKAREDHSPIFTSIEEGGISVDIGFPSLVYTFTSVFSIPIVESFVWILFLSVTFPSSLISTLSAF